MENAQSCGQPRDCEPGEFVNALATTAGDRQCEPCPSGTHSPGTNATTCSACDPGTFSEAGASRCDPWTVCKPGSYVSHAGSVTEDQGCSLCPENQQSTRDNQSQCIGIGECAAGTEQTRAATQTTPAECAPCPAGTHCPGGPAAKTPCTTGTWDHDADPATACIAWRTCSPGERVSSTGTATKDRECSDCASGTFSAEIDASNCEAWTECTPGERMSAAGSATKDRECAPCEGGTFSTTNNAPTCTAWSVCSPGERVASVGSITRDRTCSDCAAGTFSTVSNAANCTAFTECSPGQHVSTVGNATRNSECTNCSDGTFSSAYNAATCSAWKTCGAGERVTTAGNATRDVACAECAAGTFSVGNNAMSCSTCPAGTYSAQHASSCTPCPPGTDSSPGASSCVACAAVCGGSCVNDLASNTKHCGACGHDCLGGTCFNGQCQPITLATGQNRPWRIALNSTRVFWTNSWAGSSTNTESVMSAKLDGSDRKVLASGLRSAWGIAANDTAVFFTSQNDPPLASLGSIHRVPVDGGTVQQISETDSAPREIVIDGTKAYAAFWEKGVAAVSLSQVSTTTTWLASGWGPWGIAVDGATASVYWSNVDIRSLVKRSTDGSGTAQTLATQLWQNGNAAKQAHIRIYDGDLYFTADTAVYKTNLFGSAPTAIVINQESPAGLAVDGSGVYFSNNTSSGPIVRYDASGTRVLASGQGNPTAIALDAKAVYWTNSATGEVMKIAK